MKRANANSVYEFKWKCSQLTSIQSNPLFSVECNWKYLAEPMVQSSNSIQSTKLAPSFFLQEASPRVRLSAQSLKIMMIDVSHGMICIQFDFLLRRNVIYSVAKLFDASCQANWGVICSSSIATTCFFRNFSIFQHICVFTSGFTIAYHITSIGYPKINNIRVYLKLCHMYIGKVYQLWTWCFPIWPQ